MVKSQSTSNVFRNAGRFVTPGGGGGYNCSRDMKYWKKKGKEANAGSKIQLAIIVLAHKNFAPNN
jgi:hypothetical protein